MIRVMMADDNAEIRDRLHRYLKTKPDIDIVGSACNGAEAECMLRRLNPDVLLLDLVMPEIDGLELMRRMQAQPGASAVQVIVLTSLMRDGIIRQAMLLGASYYMVKPFDPESLYRRIVLFGRDNVRRAPSPDRTPDRTPGAIDALLLRAGIPGTVKGFAYLREALGARLEKSGDLRITKTLYPLLAERFGEKPTNVERAMRSAINAAFKRGTLSRCGLFPAEKRPSNAEFVTRMLEALEEES